MNLNLLNKQVNLDPEENEELSRKDFPRQNVDVNSAQSGFISVTELY
jgi:hypothetical protein